ncbi:uncharacterized protein B0P05DRAFT_153200 [Gilbertella persicaria]|uniref:uncharacterized protein n=1 Tax=Gilbertella persicaria TaxID=101096 RepID=UPI00221FC72E|nr:uncharacterized protein B0P05DRAFT_153200 [Gilbertella persicaria]KAI8075455.1 hypothetical protein B0P05DRAFT_153200 [Gilbertella persicaria]
MLNRHDFWLYAIRMAVLGQLQQISLLFQHVLKSNAFSQFNDVLTCMLDVRNHINNDKIDYGNMQKALLKLQHMNFTDSVCQHHANQLGIVMSILLGYEHIILQHTKSDIHALICSAYYQPQTPTSIESFATAFYTKHSQFPSSMIRSLMINDLYAAIEQSLKLDWWFLAHWTDLLTLRNMLDRPIEIQTTKGILPLDIKHHFILHYASFLKNQLGQWKEAFSYSLDCSDIGRRVVIKVCGFMMLLFTHVILAFGTIGLEDGRRQTARCY